MSGWVPGTKRFGIVRGVYPDQSKWIEAVPLCWLTEDENHRYWPPRGELEPDLFDKLVKRLEVPGAYWEKHKIKVLSKYASYEAARLCLGNALKDSDMSAFDEAKLGKGKRHRKAKQIFDPSQGFDSPASSPQPKKRKGKKDANKSKSSVSTSKKDLIPDPPSPPSDNDRSNSPFEEGVDFFEGTQLERYRDQYSDGQDLRRQFSDEEETGQSPPSATHYREDLSSPINSLTWDDSGLGRSSVVSSRSAESLMSQTVTGIKEAAFAIYSDDSDDAGGVNEASDIPAAEDPGNRKTQQPRRSQRIRTKSFGRKSASDYPSGDDSDDPQQVRTSRSNRTASARKGASAKPSDNDPRQVRTSQNNNSTTSTSASNGASANPSDNGPEDPQQLCASQSNSTTSAGNGASANPSDGDPEDPQQLRTSQSNNSTSAGNGASANLSDVDPEDSHRTSQSNSTTSASNGASINPSDNAADDPQQVSTSQSKSRTSAGNSASLNPSNDDPDVRQQNRASRNIRTKSAGRDGQRAPVNAPNVVSAVPQKNKTIPRTSRNYVEDDERPSCSNWSYPNPEENDAYSTRRPPQSNYRAFANRGRNDGRRSQSASGQPQNNDDAYSTRRPPQSNSRASANRGQNEGRRYHPASGQPDNDDDSYFPRRPPQSNSRGSANRGQNDGRRSQSASGQPQNDDDAYFPRRPPQSNSRTIANRGRNDGRLSHPASGQPENDDDAYSPPRPPQSNSRAIANRGRNDAKRSHPASGQPENDDEAYSPRRPPQSNSKASSTRGRNDGRCSHPASGQPNNDDDAYFPRRPPLSNSRASANRERNGGRRSHSASGPEENDDEDYHPRRPSASSRVGVNFSSGDRPHSRGMQVQRNATRNLLRIAQEGNNKDDANQAMLNKLDDIQQSIQNLAGTRRVALTRNQYFDEWPLLTVAQFNDLKRRLSDPGFFNEAVDEMISFGGSNLEDMVRRVLKSVMDRRLRQRFSLYGLQGNLKLHDSILWRALIQACKNSPDCPGLTVKKVETAAKNLLRHAKDPVPE